jgi:gluconate 2-dehydrogenase gamma chain
MKLMEGNKIDKQLWNKPSSFFSIVLTHTMQGFYGSPIHGGNKNHMSFNMLKVDGMLKVRLESPSKQG